MDAWANTTASQSSSSDITPESVTKAMKAIRELLPPLPTAEQRAWAKLCGFPDYPGFKVGLAAWEELKRRTRASDDRRGLFSDRISGVPVVMDPELPPNEVLSAEDLWKRMQNESCLGGRNLGDAHSQGRLPPV